MLLNRTVCILSMICVALLLAPVEAQEKKEPSGTIDINETQFALIIGGSTGGGVLHFQGKDYPFKTRGLSLGGAGVTKVSATGKVYDMTDVSQFPGQYKKLRVGAALVGGTGGLNMVNDKGVILNLKSNLKGVGLTMGVEAVTITMK